MKVTYNWLKDFVDIKIPAQALAEKLTLTGLEVTSLELKDGDCVFEIEVTSNRPDWLSVIGIAREIAAITNSPDARLRSVGIPPYMIDARREKLKTQKAKLLNAKRYPCLAHGFAARRAGSPHGEAVGRRALNAKGFQIKVADNRDCPLYTVRIIRGVKVGSSPEWLKKRLELIGCRSINNVVDITNYILFETGQPLHAFDLDKIGSLSIIVRRAQAGEEIITIDGANRILTEDMLIIASGEDKVSKPIAIAGVIGGKDTEVTEGSKNILLEAAVFNPIVVRHTRQRLGISTESSYRFERAVDKANIESVSLGAAAMITSLSGGEVVFNQASSFLKGPSPEVVLDISSVDKILGVDIPVPTVKKILSALGFNIKQKGKNILRVGIPFHRSDINMEADLLEEISRVYGYDKIPQTLPAVRPQGISAWDTKSIISQIKNTLIGLGLDEVITYNLIARNLLTDLCGDKDFSNVEIRNPLSQEQEILRPTLIPSLIKAVGHNLNQKQADINIFEVAKVFSMSSGIPNEEQVIGIALCVQSSQAGVLGIKGILEALFTRLGIKGWGFGQSVLQGEIEVYIPPHQLRYSEGYPCNWCGGKEKIALIKDIGKEILERADIKNKKVVTAEILLDKALTRASFKKQVEPLPVYPGISRDISVILKEEIMAGDVLETITENAPEFLRDVRITDYYRGKQIPDGFKGLTISCLYRSGERTLTESEINPLHNAICNLLSDKFSAKIR